MPKIGISVTLDEANLLWLKGRTLATKGRSVSEALDDLVTAARTGGSNPPAAVRSVVGTVDVAGDDPELDRADAYIQGLASASLARPLLVRERPATARRGARRSKRG